MLTKSEAEQIAKAVNAIRPDWSQPSLMAVLGDTRCRTRPMRDIAIAFITLGLDPTSKKPTRIYEHGHWWTILAPMNLTAQAPVITDNDCAICYRPLELHSRLSASDSHDFEPQHARISGERMTDDVRERLDAASKEAALTWTAEKEPDQPTDPRPAEDVINERQKV